MHFSLVDTSVTHVSHVFHSLMMQTQNLKDVSTAWQVRTQTSSVILYFTLTAVYREFMAINIKTLRLMSVSFGRL